LPTMFPTLLPTMLPAQPPKNQILLMYHFRAPLRHAVASLA
jgi:hypothetical protein